MSVFCLLATFIQAQQVVSIDLQGDTVVLVYEYPVNGKVRSDYQLIYRPAVCGTKDTITLPVQEFQGDNYIRQAHRDFVLNAPKGSTEQTYNPIKNVQSPVRDTVILPLKGNEWLFTDTVGLCLERQKEGCCQLADLDKTCGERNLYPMPLFVTPDTSDMAEQKDSIIEDTVLPFVSPRYMPSEIAGLTVQKRVPEVIKHINSGVLRSLEDYRPYTTTEILSKDSDALLVYFDLDKIELREDFRNNKVILDSVLYLVNQLMQDTAVEIKLVQIVGLASIEGPLQHNNWLAGQRAKALEQYIRDRHPEMTDDMFESANGGEGWNELRYAVEQSEEFEGRDEILWIIDNVKDVNIRERRIKMVNEGRTYAYMLENILIDQRNSGYIRIFYDVTDDEARIINKSVKLLQDAYLLEEDEDKQAMYGEVLEMLRKVEKDPRSWNVLGVALWFNAEYADDAESRDRFMQEAKQWWERAAANGDPEAVKNLKLIESKK